MHIPKRQPCDLQVAREQCKRPSSRRGLLSDVSRVSAMLAVECFRPKPKAVAFATDPSSLGPCETKYPSVNANRSNNRGFDCISGTGDMGTGRTPQPHFQSRPCRQILCASTGKDNRSVERRESRTHGRP